MIPDDLFDSGALKQQRKQERKQFWKDNGLTFLTSDEDESFDHKRVRYEYFGKEFFKYKPALAAELQEIATERKKIVKGERG